MGNVLASVSMLVSICKRAMYKTSRPTDQRDFTLEDIGVPLLLERVSSCGSVFAFAAHTRADPRDLETIVIERRVQRALNVLEARLMSARPDRLVDLVGASWFISPRTVTVTLDRVGSCRLAILRLSPFLIPELVTLVTMYLNDYLDRKHAPIFCNFTASGCLQPTTFLLDPGRTTPNMLPCLLSPPPPPPPQSTVSAPTYQFKYEAFPSETAYRNERQYALVPTESPMFAKLTHLKQQSIGTGSSDKAFWRGWSKASDMYPRVLTGTNALTEEEKNDWSLVTIRSAPNLHQAQLAAGDLRALFRDGAFYQSYRISDWKQSLGPSGIAIPCPCEHCTAPDDSDHVDYETEADKRYDCKILHADVPFAKMGIFVDFSLQLR